jgi:hypothetical protein
MPEYIKQGKVMKKFMVYTAIVLCAATPLVTRAQLPSVPGFGSKSSGGPDLIASQTGLVTSYVGASKDVLGAQSKMLQALGLKDQAAKAQAEADSLSAGATTGNLKDEEAAQSDASKQLADALKAPAPALDAEAKTTYTQGLTLLAAGLIKYTGMRTDIDAFKNGLSGASMLQTPKLQSGAYIVKSFPGNLQNLTETMKNAVAFAKSHGIEVPPEATSVI